MEEVVYEGGQQEPEVQVYYKKSDGSKVEFREDEYQIAYGKNIAAGKNKGTIKISGIGSSYGGNVTIKFDILSKDLLLYDETK